MKQPIPVKGSGQHAFDRASAFRELRIEDRLGAKSAQIMLRKLTERLEGEGFGRVRNHSLLKPDEVVFNRGLDGKGNESGKSNFFVFVRANKDGTLEVHYSNPDYSASAATLDSDRVNVVRRISDAGERTIGGTVDEILAAAAKKPEGAYFSVMHGHWGSVDGKDLFKMHIDDGESPAWAVIRQMMLYNIDYDATGHHNHIDFDLLDRITGLEKSVGIVKIISCELTLPYRRVDKEVEVEGADGQMVKRMAKPNGPHLNLWFATREAAEGYNQAVLMNREDLYLPAFAPNMHPEGIIAANDELVRRGELVVGIAHPACDMNLPAVGLLNRVGAGDWSLQKALMFVKKHANAIGAYNLTLPDSQKIKFEGPDARENRKYFRELVKKWGLGRKLYLNSVNLAFWHEMQEQYGKWGYADHDIHNYVPPGYNVYVRGLGRMFNVVTPVVKPVGRKMNPKEMAGLMGGEEAGRWIKPSIFYEIMMDGNNIVWQRRNETTWDRIKAWIAKMGERAKKIPVLWHDLWQRGIDILR
jgi:hypothetical protein